MEATALSPEESRELAALRRRAYGPDPDIGADPAAVARLEALERVSRHRAPPELPPRPAPPVPPARDDLAALEEATRPPGSVDAAEPGFPVADGFSSGSARPPEERAEGWALRAPRARFGRGRALLRRRWPAVLTAVVLVGSLVWGVTQLSEPRSDSSLGRIPAGEEGERLARQGFLDAADVTVDEVQRFEDYEQLQIWVVLATSGDRCLVVEAERYGILGVNCTPPGLDPVIDLRIWRGMRANIFGELPPNTFLRFSHTGDRVHVWIRQPAQVS
jgi:hypothetical protein